jgi:hypothetical protein
MRWLRLGFVLLPAACGAPEFRSQTLADGSRSFECELPMDQCVRLAQDSCRHQRFRILSGSSETRVRDAPPYEQAYHTSRLRLRCTNDGGQPWLLGEESQAEAGAAPGRVCAGGDTRACVGSAGCAGGQSCLPDGSGFGACDCGPAPPSVAPAPASPASSSPSAAPSPAAPAPAAPSPAAPSPGTSDASGAPVNAPPTP